MDDCVRFEVADALRFRREAPYGRLVTNPPYGQRMMEQRQAQQLLRGFGRTVGGQKDYGVYIISSEEELERYYGRRCTKKRKLYNGMIKCNLFMYF